MSFFFESFDKTKCNYFIIRVRNNNKMPYIEKHYKNTILQTYDNSKFNHVNIEDIVKWSGEKLCKTISKDYILDSIDESDYIIVSSSVNINKTRSKQISNKLCGIVLLKKYKSHIYITLICGLLGLGKKLLNIVEKIAKHSNIKKIKLDSVDTPIYFYLKNGFIFDRGIDTYEISEDYRSYIKYPKKISNPPPNYDKKGKKIDIGYIYDESYGGHKYYWIVIEDSGIKRWKLIKPGYMLLSKIKPDVKKYILSRKPNLLIPYETKTKGGTKKKYLRAGMITHLRNIKTKKMDQDVNVCMTKKL